MATNGGSLGSIYERLSSAPEYHPFNADTFSDWSMEAGDMIRVSRDGENYDSPVHSASLSWHGQSQISVSSDGNEKRESISKATKRKYARGGGGYRSDERLWKRMFDDYNGLTSFFEFTASRMYMEFQGQYDGLSSEFEMTRSRIAWEFAGAYDGLSSAFEMTRSRMYVEFAGMYDGLNSNFELTRSSLRTEFRGMYDGLSSSFEVTRSALRTEFKGLYDGLSSDFSITRSALSAEFKGLYDGLSSDFSITRSALRAEFSGMYDGLNSSLAVTRSELRTEFKGLYDGLSSDFSITRSALRAEFSGLYDGLSSDLTVTRSALRAEFSGLYDGLSSDLTVTRSALRAEFKGMYDGLDSSFSVTRSALRTEFKGLYDGLSSDLTVTRSTLRAEFKGQYDGLSSEFSITRSQIRSEVSSYYSGLKSYVQQEAGKWSVFVEGTGNNAHIKPAAIQAAIDADTGHSIINLSADQIILDGTTTIDDVFTISDNRVYAKVPMRVNGDIMAESLTLRHGSDSDTLEQEDLAGVIKSASVSGNTLTLTPVHGDPITFSKAVSLAGAWDNGNFPLTVNATQTNSGSTTNVGSKTIGFTNASDFYLTVEKNGDVSAFGSSKKLINVPYKIVHHAGGVVGDQDRFAGSLASVDATSVYNNGWGDSYAEVKLNYSSDQALTGSRKTITVMPNAKATPTGEGVNIQNKGITVSVAYAVTAANAIVTDPASIPTGYSKPTGKDYYIKNSGTNAEIRIYLKPTLTVDGSVLNNGNDAQITNLQTVATQIYADGYTAGETAGSGSVPVYYIHDEWGTGNDSNKLFIRRSTDTSDPTSITHTIEPGVVLSYDSTTHKYTATGKVMFDGYQHDSTSTTESTAEGYIDGWEDSYAEVKLNYTTNQTITSDGGSVTIMPNAKATPTGEGVNIQNKGITVTANIPYAVTAGSVSETTYATVPSGYSRPSGKNYYVKNNTSGAATEIMLCVFPTMTVDGKSLNSTGTYKAGITTQPTQIYRDGYSAGNTAGIASVKVSGTWDTIGENVENDNRLKIEPVTSGGLSSLTYIISAAATLSYDSTTHTYTASAQAKVDGNNRGNADTDTTNGGQGYQDGQDSVTVDRVALYDEYAKLADSANAGANDVRSDIYIQGTASNGAVKTDSLFKLAKQTYNSGKHCVVLTGQAKNGNNYENDVVIGRISTESVYEDGIDSVVLNTPYWRDFTPAAQGDTDGDNATTYNALICTASDMSDGTARSKTVPIAIDVDTANKIAKVTAGGYIRAKKSIPYSVTAANAFVVDASTVPSGYSKPNGKDYYINSSERVRIYLKPTLTVDGHTLNSDGAQQTNLETIVSQIYADGKSAGNTAGKDSVGLQSDFTFSPNVQMTGSETDPSSNVNTISISTVGKTINSSLSKSVFIDSGSWDETGLNRTVYLKRTEGGKTYKLAKATVSTTVSDWQLSYQSAPYTYRLKARINGVLKESSSTFYATNAYDNGWSGCYQSVEIQQTGTVDYGQTVTFSAYAKQSSGASSAAKAGITITIPANKIARSAVLGGVSGSGQNHELTITAADGSTKTIVVDASGVYTTARQGYVTTQARDESVASAIADYSPKASNAVKLGARDGSTNKWNFSVENGAGTDIGPYKVDLSNVLETVSISSYTLTHAPSNITYSGLQNNSSGFTIVNADQGENASAYIVTEAELQLSNSDTKTKQYRYLGTAPTLLYKYAYQQGAGSVALTSYTLEHAPSNVTYSGIQNNDSGFAIVNPQYGENASAYIVTKAVLQIGSNPATTQYRYLGTAPTLLYKYAYQQGAASASGSTTDYNNGWKAAYNAVNGISGYFPTKTPSTITQSIYTAKPSSTVDGGYTSYQYYADADTNYAYIKYVQSGGTVSSGKVVARKQLTGTITAGSLTSQSSLAGTSAIDSFEDGTTKLSNSNLVCDSNAAYKSYKFKVTCGSYTKWYSFRVA